METDIKDFSQFGLDFRLLKALNELKYVIPTEVQSKLYIAMSDRKSIIIAARTGSGKTAAYMIPIIQYLLNDNNEAIQKTSVLILCPSKELCKQSETMLKFFMKYTELSCVNISEKDLTSLKPILLTNPDFVIGTPTKIYDLIKYRLVTNFTQNLSHIVVDEADLVSAFGHQESLEKLTGSVDVEKCQICLVSATVVSDSLNLSLLGNIDWVKLVLEDNKTLPSSDKLTQYVKRCSEDEKFNILVAMMKLKMIRGKTIIFTNNTDKCYRIKYILDCFYIKSVILNSHLPLECRNHVMDQFNHGKYDLLLASEENDTEEMKTKIKSEPQIKQDTEYSVSRGIDYHLVSNVINFDCPNSWSSYAHRVGRCARNNEKGNSLVFVSIRDNEVFDTIEKNLKLENNGKSCLNEFKISKDVISPLEYRVQEMKARCTRHVIKQAKLNDIKKEIKNAMVIKKEIDLQPDEIKGLEHGETLVIKRSSELKNIPSYMKCSDKSNKKIKVKKDKQKPGKRRQAKIVDGKFVKPKLDNPLFSFKRKQKKN